MTEEDKLTKVSMEIILHAGDARSFATQALVSAKKFDFKNAKDMMDKADQEIKLSHKAQTEIIQDEARGIKHHASLLFGHAQDTLMTIMSEINMSKEMIDILKIIAESHK